MVEKATVSTAIVNSGLSSVETRGRAAGQNEIFKATRPDRYPGLPIVALIDAGSASASEIIAGALQVHDRAVLIGETTYGKGSVQSLFRLTGGDVLRLTTARWFTPVGRSIQADAQEVPAEPPHTLSISGQLVQPMQVEGRPEYQSDAGRRLSGGGGITPDLFVQPTALSTDEVAAVQRLFRRGSTFAIALFDFAVRYVGEHPDLEPGFVLQGTDLDAFYRTLPSFDASGDSVEYTRAQRFVRFQVEREIALQAWGDAGQFVQLRQHDRQLVTALGLLSEVDDPAGLLAAVAGMSVETVPGR
jgi:carboxyl-terminal processing protease